MQVCSIASGQPNNSASRTLIDELLADQRRLTAVEQFSKAHDAHRIATSRYRELIPLSAPVAGQQYAFEVDLDKCSGCKACVTACHSLNGLDDDETWRDVGMLVSDDWRRPLQQVVTTACHHCVDPGCLNGCPVLAYEKDPLTGIVRHLDDQCIGCEYCILKCPYDVPKYSEQRGIVRKCDMCSQRLASGEAPACVQACPNEAIRITVIDQHTVRATFRGGVLATNGFLPASPDPAITLPTTRYASREALPHYLVPSNASELHLQAPHWPLIVMLVATQCGVGTLSFLPAAPGLAQRPLLVLGLMATVAGLAASILHLGKPLKAWRSFLGLRRSWLSREIVTFAIFVTLAASARAAAPPFEALAYLTALVGLLGVFCSAKIYDDTPRPFWRGSRSIGKFFGTTAVLGLAVTWSVATLPWLPIALALVMTIKLAGEHHLLRRADHDIAEQTWPKDGDFFNWSLAHSAVLMRDKLGLVTRSRFLCGLLGGILLPLVSLAATDASPHILPIVAALLCLAGEVLERYTFFRAVVPPRMP